MIIKAGIEHAQDLMEIGAETFVDAHKESAAVHEIDKYVREKYNLPYISKELANPVNMFHIIKQQDKFAGFSKMMFNADHPDIQAPDISKMDQIYLLNSFKGLGLGAKLLQYNIELSKASNQTGMWLVVWIRNLHSILFYQKFGFRIIADRDFYLTNTHTNRCHVMYLEYA